MNHFHLWDVVGVTIKTGAVRVMDRNMTAENAEAYVKMAVMRRGVENEFFKSVPAGSAGNGSGDA